MSDQKGILNKDQEKVIAKFLDEKIKFEKVWLEALDGVVFGTVVSLVDDYGLDAINAVYKEPLATMADGLLEEDYEKAAMAAATLLDIIIDIPNVSDSKEAILFTSTVQYIANLVNLFSIENVVNEIAE